jgi:hypothetical protein
MVAYTIRDPYYMAWRILRAAGECEYYSAHGWLPARDRSFWFALAIGLLVGALSGWVPAPTRRATAWLSAVAGFIAAALVRLPMSVVE